MTSAENYNFIFNIPNLVIFKEENKIADNSMGFVKAVLPQS